MTTNPMPKRRPNTPPALALGAMNFGNRTDPKESDRIVRRALERGIGIFDTANSYNGGESERILGRSLGADRDKVILASKVGLGPVPSKREGLSAGAMRVALDASLERLGCGHVDLYYLHVPDRATPIAQTLDAMKGLVDSGRVRSWGISNYASWEVFEMNLLADERGLARPVVGQMLYNAIHRQLDVEYFAFARRYPIHTTTYNALAGGLLSGRHTFAETPLEGSRFHGNATSSSFAWWRRERGARSWTSRTRGWRRGRTSIRSSWARRASSSSIKPSTPRAASCRRRRSPASTTSQKSGSAPTRTTSADALRVLCASAANSSRSLIRVSERTTLR
jgi:aryl-alcohol dehydrogenase-like predicted oxidoreductase